MHEQQLNIVDIVDEEGLVAGGDHVAGLLVGAVSDLYSQENQMISNVISFAFPRASRSNARVESSSKTYRGHGNVALEPSADTVVNTLRLAP